MSEAQEKSPLDGLKPEQIEILRNVYRYTDEAEYTEEDLALAKVMFDTPEKFRLLRKILGVHTPNERGITFAGVQSLVDANPADFQHYAIETAINHLADEKVRRSLLSFYNLLKNNIVDETLENFKAQNKEEFEEQKRTEEFEEQQEAEKRTLPENV